MKDKNQRDFQKGAPLFCKKAPRPEDLAGGFSFLWENRRAWEKKENSEKSPGFCRISYILVKEKIVGKALENSQIL